MTTETSNARGELRMTDIREDAREPLQLLRERLCNNEEGWRALCQIMPMLAAAPPPAAARGDVRAVLQEMRDRQVARRFKSQTLIDWADRIESALAAEGVQAGEVEQRARELFTAQADRLAAPWDRQWEPSKEYWRAKAREALSQQPEARGVVDVTDAMIERAAYCIPGAVPTLAKAREVAREILTAALTEASNVR